MRLGFSAPCGASTPSDPLAGTSPPEVTPAVSRATSVSGGVPPSCGSGSRPPRGAGTPRPFGRDEPSRGDARRLAGNLRQRRGTPLMRLGFSPPEVRVPPSDPLAGASPPEGTPAVSRSPSAAGYPPHAARVLGPLEVRAPPSAPLAGASPPEVTPRRLAVTPGQWGVPPQAARVLGPLEVRAPPSIPFGRGKPSGGDARRLAVTPGQWGVPLKRLGFSGPSR